ncbi:phage tail tape measure protein [Tabrizicola sp. M-4]|uniref:phage tail tape measure protein n=1 Tax=Tabrizicola sp. M-4 TaxID=3055847 RepID=UPI003DA9F155
MSEDIQALLVRLEANATKMISETKKASKTVSDELRKIDREFRQTNSGATEGLARKGRQMRESAGEYRNLGFAAQNAAFQVGDFFTQVAGGTEPTRAMAQQLPQLLGSMGLIGALAGAAAAALIPLAGNLLNAGESSMTAEEAISNLGKAIDSYRAALENVQTPSAELVAQYGSLSAAARDFALALAEINRVSAFDALTQSIDSVTGPLLALRDVMRDEFGGEIAGTDNWRFLAEELGVAEANASALAVAMYAFDTATGPARQAEAAQRLSELLLASAGSYEAMNPAARRLYDETIRIGDEAADLSGATEAVSRSAEQIAKNMASAYQMYAMTRGMATELANETARASAAAASLAYGKVANEGGMDSIARATMREFTPNPFGTLASGAGGAARPAPRGGGGGGGGGGGNDVAAEAKRIYDETRTAAEKYRIEEQRLGELLRMNAITQDTYSRAIDGLKDKYRDTSDSLSQFSDAFRSGFSDMISGVIDGSMKAEDAVRRMVTRLASMMIENQIFNLLGSLMPNVFGAGGFLPLTKSAMGNVFMGGRVQAFATGGVVNGPTAFPMRGGMGLMGEAGPEAILPLTRVNGSLGVRASGAGGGSRTMVQVINQGGGEVRQERQQGPGGDELIRITVGKQIARGDHDSAMRGRYSARPAGVKR